MDCTPPGRVFKIQCKNIYNTNTPTRSVTMFCVFFREHELHEFHESNTVNKPNEICANRIRIARISHPDGIRVIRF